MPGSQHPENQGNSSKKQASLSAVAPPPPPSTGEYSRRCDVCSVNISGPDLWDAHVKAMPHHNLLKRAVEAAVGKAGGSTKPVLKSAVVTILTEAHPQYFSDTATQAAAISMMVGCKRLVKSYDASGRALLCLSTPVSPAVASKPSEANRPAAVASSKKSDANRPCDVCGTTVPGTDDNWQQHVMGKNHLNSLGIVAQNAVRSVGGSSTAAVLKARVIEELIKTHPKYFADKTARADAIKLAIDRKLVVETQSGTIVHLRVADLDSASSDSSDVASTAEYPRRCDICSTGPIDSRNNWNQHIKSKKHLENARATSTASEAVAPSSGVPHPTQQSSPQPMQQLNSQPTGHADSAPLSPAAVSYPRQCDVCRVSIPSPAIWDEHIEGSHHLVLVKHAVQQALERSSDGAALDRLLQDSYPMYFAEKAARVRAIFEALKESRDATAAPPVSVPPPPATVELPQQTNQKLDAPNPPQEAHRNEEISHQAAVSPKHSDAGRQCDVCRATISGTNDNWIEHVKGKSHMSRLGVAVQEAVRSVGGFSTAVLKSKVVSALIDSHPIVFADKTARADAIKLAIDRSLVVESQTGSDAMLRIFSAPTVDVRGDAAASCKVSEVKVTGGAETQKTDANGKVHLDRAVGFVLQAVRSVAGGDSSKAVQKSEVVEHLMKTHPQHFAKKPARAEAIKLAIDRKLVVETQSGTIVYLRLVQSAPQPSAATPPAANASASDPQVPPPALGTTYPRQCDLCGDVAANISEWVRHVWGRKHQDKLANAARTFASQQATVELRRCDVCSTTDNWEAHVKTENHLTKVGVAVQNAVRDAGGASVPAFKSEVANNLIKAHPEYFNEKSTRDAAIELAIGRSLVIESIVEGGQRKLRLGKPRASATRAGPATGVPPESLPSVPADWKRTLTKEEISSLPLGHFEGNILVWSTPKEAEAAAKKLLKEPLLGFDTETKPVFVAGVPRPPPSLLQLATKDEAHLFQLDKCGLTPSMIHVLSSNTIVKAGVGIIDDFRGLQRVAPFSSKGLAELADVAKKIGTGTGLRHLAAVLFGFKISKTEATSNWAADELSNAQVRYAATDAWLGYRIYTAFRSQRLVSGPTTTMPANAPASANGGAPPVRVATSSTTPQASFGGSNFGRPNPHPELEQTEMCSKGDDCRRYDPVTGERHGCWFAHSADELRCKAFIFGRCHDPNCSLKHTVSAKVREECAARSVCSISVGTRPEFVTLNFVRKLPSPKLPAQLESLVARNRATAVASTGFGAPTADRFLIDRYMCGEAHLNGEKVTIALNDDATHVFSTTQSACTFVRCALQLEHYQQLSDVRRYDMEEVLIIKRHPSKPLYSIKCEGLAEKRPSVLRGDRIIVRSNRTLREHHGFVHFVALDLVWVSFSADMEREISPNVTWKVVFTIQQTPFCRQLLALSSTKTLLSSEERFAEPATSSHGHELRLNEKQQQCVGRVLDTARDVGRLGLTLIHGPPGTGKTTTVVAALLLLLLRRSRVLVCCPSNQAADLIVERLAELHLSTTGVAIDRSRMARIYGLSMLDAEVPESVKPYKAQPEDYSAIGTTCDVVVTTIMTAGLLYSLGVDMHSSFDYIVVDEAGQATESELAVPLTFASPSKGTHVVLAGDHKQLGPVLRSKVAIEYGFGRSTLERLMQHPEIDRHAIQLVENYRSHPEILNLYNTLTYRNTLVACAPQNNTSIAAAMGDIFPDPTKPVVFRHVEGIEDRERDSPSWMNPRECDEVLVILRRLFSHTGTGVAFGDVVVLTPYQKQCTKIRAKIHYEFLNEKLPFVVDKYDKQKPPIQVCSVEQFQGREAKFVILSCVRSKKTEFVQMDIKHSIGFLKQPKRLNVAISRAIAGLIIVGNAGMLQTDDGWQALIRLLTTGGHAVRDGDGKLTKTLSSWLQGANAMLETGAASFRATLGGLMLGHHPRAQVDEDTTSASLSSLVYDVDKFKTLSVEEIADLKNKYRTARERREAEVAAASADDDQPNHTIDGDWGRKDE